jgi:hypothetical protein
MKRTALVLLLLCIAVTAQTTAAPPASAPQNENARKAREVIDKGIAALGGEAYLNATERSEEGRFFTFHHGQATGTPVLFGLYTKYPDKDRLEIIHLRSYHFLIFDVGSIPVKDKSDIIVIHNGDQGYEITYKGTAAIEREDMITYVRRREHSLDAVLRRWIHEPGVALFYDGSTIASGKPVAQVTVMNAKNDSVTLFFDENTHLPAKKSYSWRDPTDKYRNTEEEIYDNYRPTDGVMAPHSITRYYNGDMSYQRLLNTVSFSQKLADNLFQANSTYDPKAPLKK